MTGSCRIIVNADDFGMSSQINHAIVEAFQKNLISSTTMMANMPAFDEACCMRSAEQIRTERLFPVSLHQLGTEEHGYTPNRE